jgi:hypothetical protein
MESNVIDVKDLFEALKTDYEKQKFIEAQFQVVLELQTKMKTLEEENLHLKELLVANAPNINIPIPIIVTPEEFLIDKQISILEQRGRSLGAELSLEEVKKLDLLLKNKKMIKDGQQTIEVKGKPVKGKLSNKELALIASKKVEPHEEAE